MTNLGNQYIDEYIAPPLETVNYDGNSRYPCLLTSSMDSKLLPI